MNNFSSTSYHSPEKIFFAVSLILCVLLGAYAWRRFAPGNTGVEHETDQTHVSDNQRPMKIEAIRWLAPFQNMNYQNSPFDICLKLKPQRTTPQPKTTPPTHPTTQKQNVEKTVPKPPPTAPRPPETFSIQYRGHYTNLAGIHYAMLSVKNMTDGKEENLIMTKQEDFMSHFKLTDFNDSIATITVRGNRTLTIPWNEIEKIEINLHAPKPNTTTTPQGSHHD